MQVGKAVSPGPRGQGGLRPLTNRLTGLLVGLTCLTCLTSLVAGCGGGGGGSGGTGAASSSTAAGSSSAGTSGSASSGSGSSGSGSAGGSGSSSTTMTAALGKPNRLLVGLGAGNSFAQMSAEAILPDIYDAYLVAVGPTSWPYWNSPAGSYITDTAKQATAVGAVPMFTLYQMATNGDGNISQINASSFMSGYWSQARLMFQTIGSYGKPVLVNLEPDFWGYVEQQAPSGDPTQLAAYVSAEPECASQPNNAVGIAGCLIALARTYAPNAKIGFPPSLWSGTSASVAQYMVKLGANKADFIVAQTSDRDAGCMEVASPPPECSGRGSGPFYWDESNQTTPNYSQSIQAWSTVRGVMGNLPVLYWQTPMGVPSTTPGGTDQHYRDNHVHYMLTHPSQFTAIGVFAVVFSSGASSQTTIATDGGQFQGLFQSYLKAPAAYP